MLDAPELLTVHAPEGRPRITLRIRLPDRTLTVEIAAKSLRKAQTAIREARPDNITLALQGHLTATDVVAEAGLSKTDTTMTRSVITQEPGVAAERRAAQRAWRLRQANRARETAERNEAAGGNIAA